MKSKQLIAKVSMLTLVGATVLGSGAALQAKTIKKCVVNKNVCKPQVSKPGCSQGNSSNQNQQGGQTTTPETTPDKDQNTNSGSENTPNNQPSNGGGSSQITPDSNNTNKQKSFEDQVLVLVNKERANNGLSPLTMDESVRKVARAKSTDMSTKHYFDHTSPTYGSPFDMLKSFGISYKSAGENIAQGYTTPEAVVKGWMNSSGHRANILSSKYTKIGIGYEANGNYWTQLFIG